MIKVSQEHQRKYEPITLTLETQEEAHKLATIFNHLGVVNAFPQLNLGIVRQTIKDLCPDPVPDRYMLWFRDALKNYRGG